MVPLRSSVLVLPVAVWGWRIATHRPFDREATVRGIELCINARIDTYFFGDPADTAKRAAIYTEAGADVLFVPGLLDPAAIRELVPMISRPLHLRGYGCAGASAVAYGLAAGAAEELLTHGTYNLLKAAAGYGKHNNLLH